MSASRLPVVVELEDGYAVTFDDCVIAWLGERRATTKNNEID